MGGGWAFLPNNRSGRMSGMRRVWRQEEKEKSEANPSKPRENLIERDLIAYDFEPKGIFFPLEKILL